MALALTIYQLFEETLVWQAPYTLEWLCIRHFREVVIDHFMLDLWIHHIPMTHNFLWIVWCWWSQMSKYKLQITKKDHFLSSSSALLPVVTSGRWSRDSCGLKEKCFHCRFAKYIYFLTSENPPHPSAKDEFFPRNCSVSIKTVYFTISIWKILWLTETHIHTWETCL